MSSLKLFLIRLLLVFLPDTRCFALKRSLYRFAGIKIGKNVRICSSAKIMGSGQLAIGDNTWVGHEALIVCSSKIEIGANVDIAPRVFVGTGTHEIDLTTPGIAGKGISKDVIVGDACWLGAGSIILPGTILGEKTVVAAGAVVTKNFESYLVIGGVPAKVIKDLNNYK